MATAAAQPLPQLPEDAIHEILLGTGRNMDSADLASARLVCRAWGHVVSSGLRSVQPVYVPDAATATAFPGVRELDLRRLHRLPDDEVAGQLQRLPGVLPRLTALRLKGLWLRAEGGLAALAQLPRLANLSLAQCRSNMVVPQLPALQPLAPTLTALDLSEAHRWDHRENGVWHGGPTLLALASLTRLRKLVLGQHYHPGVTDRDLEALAPLAGCLQHLRLSGKRAFGGGPLGALTSLTALDVPTGSGLTTAGCSGIACLQLLRRLGLRFSAVPSNGTVDHGVPVTEHYVTAMLAQLSQLTWLKLGDNAATLCLKEPAHAYAHGFPWQLRSFAVEFSPWADREATLGQWTQLTRLCLPKAQFQPARELLTLCGLRQLAELDLGSTNVPSSPKGCHQLAASLTQLRRLSVAGNMAAVTHEGLRHLATLPLLEALDVSFTVTSFPPGCSMPSLTLLDLSTPCVATEGAPPAAFCPNLRELRIGMFGQGLDDGGHAAAAVLADLNVLTGLTALHMTHMAHLSGSALAVLLAKLPAAASLRFVNLDGTVRDAGALAPLHSMRSLRLLRCWTVYHVQTSDFAAHPYLQVRNDSHDDWSPPRICQDDWDAS